MQSTRSSTRNAERDFIDSLHQLAAAPPRTLEQARAVQQRLDAAHGLALPTPDIVREIAFEDLTPVERDSFFGAFDDTVPGELA